MPRLCCAATTVGPFVLQEASSESDEEAQATAQRARTRTISGESFVSAAPTHGTMRTAVRGQWAGEEKGSRQGEEHAAAGRGVPNTTRNENDPDRDIVMAWSLECRRGGEVWGRSSSRSKEWRSRHDLAAVWHQ